MKKNYDAIDLTKFIISFFVVAIHTGLLGRYLYPMLRLAVPVFFIISGFFAFSKIGKEITYENKKSAVKHIIKRYLKLYAFWFIALLPYTLYVRNYFENGIVVGLLKFIRNFFFGSTFPVSWFIMACIIGILIVSLMSKKLSNKAILLILLPIYIFSTIMSEFRVLLSQSDAIHIVYSLFIHTLGQPYNNFLIGLFYLALGKWVADNKENLMSRKKSITGFAICFILLAAEHFIMSKTSFFEYGSDGLFMLAPTAFFLFIFVLCSDVKIKGAISLRKLSTLIYCLHPIIIELSKIIIKSINIADGFNILLFIFTGAITTVLGLIIINLEKCEKLKFLKYSH